MYINGDTHMQQQAQFIDSRIEELAEQLRKQGIAMTKLDAIRLAQNMLNKEFQSKVVNQDMNSPFAKPMGRDSDIGTKIQSLQIHIQNQEERIKQLEQQIHVLQSSLESGSYQVANNSVNNSEQHVEFANQPKIVESQNVESQNASTEESIKTQGSFFTADFEQKKETPIEQPTPTAENESKDQSFFISDDEVDLKNIF
ncbi:MAG: hypothetical protein ACMXYA_03730 [Candidatus Woesearchaeota archaeon]